MAKRLLKFAPLTPAEVAWSKKVIQDHGGRPTLRQIEDENMTKYCLEKFGRKCGPSALYQRFHKMTSDMGIQTSSPKGQHKTEKILEKSNYLVYIKNGGVKGFETEEEVRSFIQASLILGSITVFKKVNVAIDYKISFK